MEAEGIGLERNDARGPDATWPPAKDKRNYLLCADYRQESLSELYKRTDEETVQYLAKVRWSSLGENKQACPACGTVGSHYWCKSIGGWKCRDKLCGKQFTVFAGTRFHGIKMSPKTFMSILFHFVEAKDGISSRELSGLHNFNHQTIHVMTLKIREALRETMGAEPPLTGYVQADAAYFIKYVRPGNIGMGASTAAKVQQKNAGLDENGKVHNTVSPNMHALVVFVQAGQQGHREYRIARVKTENQVDLLMLGQKFCAPDAALVTDQHSAYNFYSGEFIEHHRVNHQVEFMNKDGFNTNFAEGIFARLRAAVAGAWHRTSIQNLEEYGWEVAWRQTMVGRPNNEQLEDLLRRVLTSGRAKRFVDYWSKRPLATRPKREELGMLVEVDKNDVSKKRGRPTAGIVKMHKPKQSEAPQSPQDAPTPATAPVATPKAADGPSEA